MLEIKNFHLRYKDNVIFDDTNFEAGCGVTCVIGHSGSGKSSLLNALSYHVSFSCTKYAINGQNLNDLSLEEAKAFVRSHIAYFYQEENFISDLSCFDNMRLYAKLVGKDLTNEEIKSYLKMVNLDIDEKKYPDNLSGGEKQRLALAQALAKDTEVILCDEMTASLDNELKIEILDLLKKIANDYHKIIIITSHDEDIYEQCDNLYEIENQKLNQIKTSKTKEEHAILSKKKSSLLDKKILSHYSYGKNERQIGMYVLYSFICAAVVSISAFLIFYTITFVNDQKMILDKLSQTQLMVTNQSSPVDQMTMYRYETNLAPFDLEVEDKLKNIEHVKSVYPYYMCDLFGTLINAAQRPTTADIILVSDNGEDVHKTLNIASGYPAIFPFYPEQNFDEKMITLKPEHLENGAYLNLAMVTLLDIPIEELVNYRLKLTIQIPVSSKMGKGVATLLDENGNMGEGVEYTYYEPDYVGVEIEFPIIGEIDPWYNEELGTASIYLPFNYIESLRNFVKDIEPKEGQVKWSPNTYMVFVDNAENLDEVNMQIKAIDSQIATGNRHMNMSAWYDSKSYITRSALISLAIVIVAGLLLSYAYGIFYSQKNIKDIHYFKRNGLTKKEYQRLIIEDCKLQSIAVLIISLIFSIVIYYYADLYFLIRAEITLSYRIWIPITCVLVGTIIQNLISRIEFYRKAIKE